MEIKVRNANEMFSEVFWKLKGVGVHAKTRNGPVLRFPEPVMTTVKYPQERVLFNNPRDANPIFHLCESLHMLAGRRDVKFLAQFNSKMSDYSDDGVNFNAAYGYRWRHHFGQDQLLNVIDILTRDPDSRQAVIQMWDADDLTRQTVDKCCNTQLVFEVFNNRLNMTAFNRSNDSVWGYAGANIVHFTILQEFVAGAIGVSLGEYRTVSTNLHVYTELYNTHGYIDNPPDHKAFDHYSSGQVRPRQLMSNDNYLSFLEDCEQFCDDPFNTEKTYNHSFIPKVAVPMAIVSKMRREKISDGMNYVAKIEAEDWKQATHEWVQRRISARKTAVKS